MALTTNTSWDRKIRMDLQLVVRSVGIGLLVYCGGGMAVAYREAAKRRRRRERGEGEGRRDRSE